MYQWNQWYTVHISKLYLEAMPPHAVFLQVDLASSKRDQLDRQSSVSPDSGKPEAKRVLLVLTLVMGQCGNLARDDPFWARVRSWATFQHSNATPWASLSEKKNPHFPSCLSLHPSLFLSRGFSCTGCHHSVAQPRWILHF